MQDPLDYEILEENLLFMIRADSKADLLRRMVDLLHERGRVQNPDEVYKAIMARERVRGTGLARGVACPHAKVDGVEGVEVAVARLSEPLDFEAMDGQPARHVFLILTNRKVAPEVHMRTLAAIVKCYQMPGLLEVLEKATSAREYAGSLQACDDE